MHGTLFLGLSKKQVKSNIAARREACEYLQEEGFDTLDRRLGGPAGSLAVGGRSSGILQLLRLKHEQPEPFKKFWKEFSKDEVKDAASLFKRSFPEYRGRMPVPRQGVPYHGFPDDAQIIDDALYECLKEGFEEVFNYSFGLEEKPCVLYRGDENGESWPETKDDVVGKIWVVVIDYHF